jgi:hypothetical protein
VVKIYAQKLGTRRFEALDQYANDFLSFIKGATSLFPPDNQKSHVESVIRLGDDFLNARLLTNALSKCSGDTKVFME